MVESGKRVAVVQSNYIPWKGYFDIIQRVDAFVFYDDVQYTKNDWRNRNRIKTQAGLKWLSVPTGTDLDRRICDVPIENSHWQTKHHKSLVQAYSKARCFRQFSGWLEHVYCAQNWTNLSELNQFVIREIASRFLGLGTQFLSATDFLLSGRRADRLLDLLSQVGAKVYLSGPSARAYLPEAEFALAGIRVEYVTYEGYPEYEQLFPPFVHEVSILDLLLNVGDEARRYIPLR